MIGELGVDGGIEYFCEMMWFVCFWFGLIGVFDFGFDVVW